MTTAQLLMIGNEIKNDPRGYGYGYPNRSDAQFTADINRVRDGSAGTVPSNPTAEAGAATGIILVKRKDIRPSEILEQVAQADFVAAPNALLVANYESCTQSPDPLRLVADDGSDTRILQNLKQCFGAGTATRTRLNDMAARRGSRAQELLKDLSVVLTEAEVRLAINTANSAA